jgi:glycerol-3-phosphate O-acyltransferase
VPRLSLMQLLTMLGSEKQGKLGRVFLNFGNQINLKEYLNNIGLPTINPENIDEASLRLSEKLYKEQ